MTSYGQFCAVARALEVVGERWVLLVVRELLCGATRFSEIRRGLPRIPRATLADRLRALQAAGLVEATGDGYRLTEAGLALAPVVASLATWAQAWDRRGLDDDQLDTHALTWDLRRRVDRAALPAHPVVLALEFVDRAPGDRHFWLHLDHAHVDLCRQDTGAAVDLRLAGPTEPVARWWLGELAWPALVRRPDVELDGPPELQRALPRWFQRYVFAGAATAAG